MTSTARQPSLGATPAPLGRQVLHGSFWNFLSTGGQQVLVFLFFIYLARVLSPAAFGVMSLAMMWLDIAGMIGRFGLLDVIVQRPQLQERLLSRMFWWLQGMGALLMLAMLLGAPAVARFFDSPELQPVMYWLAPLCILQNLGSIQEARLRRTFGFKALAARTVLGTLLGGLIGVGFAFAGFGVYSLVMQKFSSVLISVGLLWASDSWTPLRRTAESGSSLEYPDADAPDTLVQLLRMGWNVMWGQLVVMLNTRMTDVLVGFFMGTVALGYLRIAWRIYEFGVQFAIQPLASVALTTFSKLQAEPARLQRAYARMIELSALVLCPVFFGLAAVAPLAIPLLFGEQWRPVVPLTQAMAPMALTGAISLYFVPLMTAAGRTRQVVIFGFVQAFLTLALTALAAPLGLLPVVLAHVLRSLIMGGINLALLQRYLNMPIALTLRAVMPPLVTGIAMALLVFTAGHWLTPLLVPLLPGQAGQWLALAALVGLGAVLYTAVLWLGFSSHLRRLIAEVRPLLAQRRGAAANS